MATLSTISSMATWWEWGGRGEEGGEEGKVSRAKSSGGGATRARLAAAWRMHVYITQPPTSLAEPRRRGSTLTDLLDAALPLQLQLQPVPDLKPILYLHVLLTYLILGPWRPAAFFPRAEGNGEMRREYYTLERVWLKWCTSYDP